MAIYARKECALSGLFCLEPHLTLVQRWVLSGEGHPMV